MRQTRIAHCLGDLLVDRGLLADQQGGDHAARRSWQHLQDAFGDISPERIEGTHKACGLAGVDDHGRRQRIAHGAELLVPGDALEIEGARRRGPGRRRQVGQY